MLTNDKYSYAENNYNQSKMVVTYVANIGNIRTLGVYETTFNQKMTLGEICDDIIKSLKTPPELTHVQISDIEFEIMNY